MPFIVPTIPSSSGARVGVTGVARTPTPVQFGSTSRVGASIVAKAPLGVIGTTSSWGFDAGTAPVGASTLVVSASGSTFERANMFTAGGYTAATAEISITVEEFSGGSRLSVLTSGPTTIINLWSALLGYQIHWRDATAATTIARPVVAGRTYRCWVSASQSATCQGVSGYGFAISNFNFDMRPVFFAFA